MTRAQCRAARAWVGWSQKDLADFAGVGESTVSDFESGKHDPVRATLAAMRRALEGHGIRFGEHSLSLVGEK